MKTLISIFLQVAICFSVKAQIAIINKDNSLAIDRSDNGDSSVPITEKADQCELLKSGSCFYKT